MAPAADPAARYGPKGDHASAAAAGRDLSDDEEAIEFSFFFEVVSLSFSSSFLLSKKGKTGSAVTVERDGRERLSPLRDPVLPRERRRRKELKK